jgi:integrase
MTIVSLQGRDAPVFSSTTQPSPTAQIEPTSVGFCVSVVESRRDGALPLRSLIDLYMASYAGRDGSRPQRLSWWAAKIGDLSLKDITDDHIFYALEDLANQRSRFYAGVDAEGKPIYKAKRKPMAPATINRYAASLGAVLTWAVKKRITPRGWDNPCRRIERRPENNEVVRFLSEAERVALLEACKSARWPKLYLFVLLALTTGGRRGELQRLRWSDVDLDRRICSIPTTKNGDPRVLPLTTSVVDVLRAHSESSQALVFASRLRPDKPYNYVSEWKKALGIAKVKNFRFHDLRHTCASYLAQSGATLLEIGDVLGHRQVSVTKRYSHLATNHKSNLIDRVLGDVK